MVYLVKTLSRVNIELLILATVSLKKLSIYQENKDQMAACDAVPQIARLMSTDNEVLLMAVLRLLHNLSFDGALKDEMVKQGVVPKVGLDNSPDRYQGCCAVQTALFCNGPVLANACPFLLPLGSWPLMLVVGLHCTSCTAVTLLHEAVG